METNQIATPSLTITSTDFDTSTLYSSVTFSWHKASDGVNETELIRYDVYDDNGNYYVQAAELGKTRGEFASGTETVDNIVPGIKVNVSVYVSTDTLNSSVQESVYSATGVATFSLYDWNDTRTSCQIKASALGAKYLRITAGSTPLASDLGNALIVGSEGTLTISDLAHGNGQAIYLAAIPEASDGHKYNSKAAYSMISVPNPILGIYKPACNEGDEQYIVDIIEKQKDSSTCSERWKTGKRVLKVDDCNSIPGGAT